MGQRCAFLLATLYLVGSIACTGNLVGEHNRAQGGSSSATQGETPFVAFTPDVYVARAKMLLTGETASSAEISAVAADASQFEDIVKSWQQTPTYQAKMIRFLAQSLQQSNVVANDFDDQGVSISNLSNNQTTMLLGNLTEMMARTVLALDAQNQPFSNAMTTRSFMMTPPLAAYLSYLDHTSYSDQGSRTNSNGNSMLQSVMNFASADFANWRMVSIRQPNANEQTTLPTNATATTLVLNTPRMGFWSTPAFFAGWQTNASNQARVTMNQALIVALGHAFDGTQVVQPPSLQALDSVHAAPSTPCYGCHINLDPMRQIYRQAYTLHFSPQIDPNQRNMAGQFGFDGVGTSLSSVYDFGMQLAAHPAMAGAWVQKVCTWANDAPCLPSDSEFQRISQNFATSGSFSQLVRDVFTSPMTTYASPTDTARQTQQSLPVAKLDHLCPMLAARLSLTDPCGIAVGANPSGSMATIQQIARVLPANNYSRGQVPPVEANDPTLFFRSATENICGLLAAQLVDAANGPYSSQDPLGSVQKMVTGLMGMTDTAADTVRDKLMAHYQAAVSDTTNNPTQPQTNALRSTFIAACLSPAVMGVGLTL